MSVSKLTPNLDVFLQLYYNYNYIVNALFLIGFLKFVLGHKNPQKNISCIRILPYQIDDDITGDKNIHSYLQHHVDEMIERANELRGDNSNAPELPLIRLRYEYSGGTIPINGAKFGVDFLTKLANPRDILLSVKRKEYSSTDNKASARTGRLNLRFST